jgi:predicted transcriptional regulator of viral defense system
MKFLQLQNIEKLYFGHEDIARAFGITLQSAKVTANRYIKQGLLIRLKRNIYVLKEKWISIDREREFLLANIIQVPSYISLMTALDYYEITTQIQRDFIESIAVKRTKGVEIEQTFFNYTKINTELYSGFSRTRGFFIAAPEKAFLDAVYLMSFGRYRLDIPSIDFSKLNLEKIEDMARLFPLKTQSFLNKNEYFREA